MDVQQPRAWHSSLYLETKDASITDFKLKLLSFKIHPSLNIESFYSKHPISFSFFYQIEQFLSHWKC
jgi:hypothetical protein